MTETTENSEARRPGFPVERLVGPAPSPWPAFAEFHRQHERFDPHPEDDRANRLYAFWLAGKAEGDKLIAALAEARRRMAEAHDQSLDGWHSTSRAVLTDGMAEIDKFLWCESCAEHVEPRDVTYEETHDTRAGGCGWFVRPNASVNRSR